MFVRNGFPIVTPTAVDAGSVVNCEIMPGPPVRGALVVALSECFRGPLAPLPSQCTGSGHGVGAGAAGGRDPKDQGGPYKGLRGRVGSGPMVPRVRARPLVPLGSCGRGPPGR